ncbi:ribose 5-phosphate isomerase [Alkalihalobacillus alcalophilus ATCC 27647 = CGMCC 1.3604]|uniref:Ribose 5-phosphate isomerase n=1 Tax=Alkalihalobacillus alcalophilus ATCC 27647 = CGMCC 1.3604 TaxID=1218173 RepID=A0A094YYN4_ALKAL|nr:ribose 5-phosphate isomerase B [Alkalihalobacillus alcalophilus]KGA98652.1 ribose 5-phosphate isomerase [Alkalihalobacillus alcalophilus ATCC 27647 = CGMCC 1.3604]MED1562429.1 ribose 5-phosphate isomerase B [Alkalihalobacillus alcalophilus]THG91165.1 ribose 5-phosphate isomerase [Alkalihalobacillus alcalophilus ATCC 27647 = CGMCC 1.3604]
MKVAIACDHTALPMKEEIKKQLEELKITIIDLGAYSEERVDYPDYALEVSEQVTTGKVDRGILICGTGIGMSIMANKVKGIRCALAHDTFSAKYTRLHNNSNVLALGQRVLGNGLAREIVKVWLETEYEGGRHERRVCKIAEYEN